MNSKTILKILAVLLVSVNIILFFMVSSVYRSKYYISDGYIENTVSIFEKDGITVKAGAIPQKRFPGNVYSMSADTDYYEKVSANITGEAVATRFLIPGGYEILTESGKSVEFADGYFFKYLYRADYVPEKVNGTESVSYGTKRRIEESIESFLSAGDDGYYPSELTVSDIKLDSEKGIYSASVTQTAAKTPIYGHTLSVILDKDENVLYAEGKWSFTYDAERYTSQIYDQVNILFIDKAEAADDKPTSVHKVSPCYIIYRDEASSSVLFVPAWKIEYEGGAYKIYDAVNGNVAVTSTDR